MNYESAYDSTGERARRRKLNRVTIGIAVFVGALCVGVILVAPAIMSLLHL